MYLKILKKDITRKKVITIAVAIFIMLSAFLVASGTNMIVTLSSSIDQMFARANVPHFIQCHAGELDQAVIDEWSNNNAYVLKQQTSKMLNIHGSNIYFGENNESQGNSVMESMFVKQNSEFDYLLDLNNKVIELSQGEIGIPIYYMVKNELEVGDTVTLKYEGKSLIFTIKSFVRDAQMNPSLVSSKRFVVSDQDFEQLEKAFTDVEYQVAFQLKNLENLKTFSNEYNISELPKKGYTIDIELLKIMNALTDGLVFMVILVISLLLNIIAVLCLRFTILSTIEEDYKEIGVMKAIGFKQKQIKKVYMTKYVLIAAIASLIGFVLSIELNDVFIKNILLYVGQPEFGFVETILPLLFTGFVFIFVTGFSSLTLNKFKKISAVEALRMGNTGETYKSRNIFTLHTSKRINVNIAMGLRDVFLRLKVYGLLFVVFVICTFIVVVPLNFHNTLNSEEFITYMGMGNSDLLIDLRQTEDIQQRYLDVIETLNEDDDVIKYSPLITSQFEMVTDENMIETLIVETGDFDIFPLNYTEGYAPVLKNEIALSYLNAKEYGKEVGNYINLIIDGVKTPMLITGIYQDVTNGGKTAKATIEANYKTVSWYMIAVDLKGNVNEKMMIYTQAFSPAKVTDMEGYFDETFSNTTNQLRLLTIVAAVIAAIVAVMITALFIKMLIAKDFSQIVIMKSLGFSMKAIQTQYITRALLILNSGVILGTVLANTLGQGLTSLLMSGRGISNIIFVINPLQAYILCPLLLIVTVSITTWLSTRSMKTMSISNLQGE